MNMKLQLLSRDLREARLDLEAAIELDDIEYAEQAIIDRRIAQYRLANCEQLKWYEEEPEDEYFCDVCGHNYPVDDPCEFH